MRQLTPLRHEFTKTVLQRSCFVCRAGGFPAGAVTSVGNWATMPLVFGIMAFVYSGHGVFPSVRASMKRPEQFPKVCARSPDRTPGIDLSQMF